jgi:hypothetical protein
VFVEPFSHPCHLRRKVSLGRQLHYDRPHPVLISVLWSYGRCPSDKSPLRKKAIAMPFAASPSCQRMAQLPVR